MFPQAKRINSKHTKDIKRCKSSKITYHKPYAQKINELKHTKLNNKKKENKPDSEYLSTDTYTPIKNNYIKTKIISTYDMTLPTGYGLFDSDTDYV